MGFSGGSSSLREFLFSSLIGCSYGVLMGDLEDIYNSLLKIRFLGGSIVQNINGLIWGLLIVLEPCSSHSSKVCRLGQITLDIFIGDFQSNCRISNWEAGWHVFENLFESKCIMETVAGDSFAKVLFNLDFIMRCSSNDQLLYHTKQFAHLVK